MKKVLIFSLLTIGIILSGCKGCSEDDILANINNGNNDPMKLVMKLSGQDISDAYMIQTGQDCLESQDFKADVAIEVRTASGNPPTVIIDPTPYFELDKTNVSFFKNTSTSFDLKIPDAGAFGITVRIKLKECSMCCHGAIVLEDDKESFQCSAVEAWEEQLDKSIIHYCMAGKPKLAIEEVFLAKNRPPFNQDWLPYDKLKIRKCTDCEECKIKCN